jgi:hypothetical protein
MPAGQHISLPKFPVPFLPPNSSTPMATPGQSTTGPVPVTPPAETVPVETLLKSLQEKPLVVTSVAGGNSGYGAGQGGPMAATPPAAPAAPQ